MIKQRRVPVKPWQSCGVWAVVLALLPAAGCLIFLGALGNASTSLIVGGAALAILAVAIVVFMFLSLRPASVDASGQAKIVRRTRDEVQIETNGGAQLPDLFLNVAVWSFLQARSVYDLSLVFVFTAVNTDGAEQKITLTAKVSEELYLRYEPGAVVGIEYAMADPSFAVLEGERSYDGPAVFDFEAGNRPDELAPDHAPEVPDAAGRPPTPGASEPAVGQTDMGAVAGILCGLLASGLSVSLTAVNMTAFTDSFPVLCIPLAAIYCVPIGIGGARFGRRIGTMAGSQPALFHSVAGAIFGGFLGFGITLILARLVLVLGQ